MPDSSFDLSRVHVDVTGPEDAPVALLVHGWGSSAKLMRPLAEALSGRLRVHNIDLPGHGHTPPPPEPWGVPEYAALLRQYIDAEIQQPFTWVGHSNGGRIGLYMAGDAALNRGIERMALISPSGVRPVRTWKYYARSYTAKTLKAPFQLLPEPLREAGLDWLRHSLVWSWLGSSDYQALEGVMRSTFVKTVRCFVEDRLAAIHIPVLLLWGDADTAISRHQMDLLAEQLPDAGLFVLEGAGHYSYLDALGAVAGGILAFTGADQPEPALS
ncbi:MAG: alpha/beta hydrolase [Rhodothermales bacterium]